MNIKTVIISSLILFKIMVIPSYAVEFSYEDYEKKYKEDFYEQQRQRSKEAEERQLEKEWLRDQIIVTKIDDNNYIQKHFNGYEEHCITLFFGEVISCVNNSLLLK